jgi:hypothetical protein
LVLMFVILYFNRLMFFLPLNALDFVLDFLESFGYLAGLNVQRPLVLSVHKQRSFCHTFIRFNR